MYNLFAYLWEIETNSPYRMAKAHDIYSGLGVEVGFAEDLIKQEEGEKKSREIESDLGLIEEVDEDDNDDGDDEGKVASASTMPPVPH